MAASGQNEAGTSPQGVFTSEQVFHAVESGFLLNRGPGLLDLRITYTNNDIELRTLDPYATMAWSPRDFLPENLPKRIVIIPPTGTTYYFSGTNYSYGLPPSRSQVSVDAAKPAPFAQAAYGVEANAISPTAAGDTMIMRFRNPTGSGIRVKFRRFFTAWDSGGAARAELRFFVDSSAASDLANPRTEAIRYSPTIPAAPSLVASFATNSPASSGAQWGTFWLWDGVTYDVELDVEMAPFSSFDIQWLANPIAGSLTTDEWLISVEWDEDRELTNR